jgi:hypothetical protein
MSAIQGLRGTGQFGVDFRPTSYRELFTLIEPNGTAPLNALLSMANSESTDDPKFLHFRDEMPARVLTTNASALVGDTTITVTNIADNAFVVPGTLLLNTRTNEILRASATTVASTTTITNMTRGASGSTAAAMNSADKLVIVGYADAEGTGKPTSVSFDPTTDYNYTQIFKTGVGLTNTQKATYLRTGDKEQEMITKGLKLHMSDIERAMFWGKRFEENGSTNQPRRYTGGLFNMITNVTDAASGFATANTITENEFDRLLIENIFAWGGKQKLAICGPRVISNLQKIAKSRWQPTQVEGTYGVSMTGYSTFAGDLNVLMHPMFRQIPGFDSTMLILDLPYIKYRYMEGRDTSLKRDVQAPDADGTEHYYLTECGLELLQGRPHIVVKNWQAA